MSTVQSVDLMSLRSAVLGTIANVASKSFDRDLLTDGDSHSVVATIAGTVDGRKFSFPVDATLTVGHSTERKSKSGPSTESMLAFALQSVEAKHGKKALLTLIESLRNAYASDGELVTVDSYVELVGDISESMTQIEIKPVRGNINVANATKTVEMKISNSRVA